MPEDTNELTQVADFNSPEKRWQIEDVREAIPADQLKALELEVRMPHGYLVATVDGGKLWFPHSYKGLVTFEPTEPA